MVQQPVINVNFANIKLFLIEVCIRISKKHSQKQANNVSIVKLPTEIKNKPQTSPKSFIQKLNCPHCGKQLRVLYTATSTICTNPLCEKEIKIIHGKLLQL